MLTLLTNLGRKLWLWPLVRPFAVDRKWGAEPPAPDSGLSSLTLLLDGLFLCSQPFFDQKINIYLAV